MPKVTVLMPVWNAQAYIGQAIESVLQQSCPDFEFLIVDDGSEDKTADIIRSYKDARIRLILREHDFVASLNAGIRLSQGEYIARMDSDDIMHTERLKIQIQRMDEMRDIAVCGSWMQCFGEKCVTRVISAGRGRINNPVMALLERNIIFHPTAMLRKSFLMENKLRYREYARAEDYRLWGDIAECGGQFYIEPQVLLFYRISPQQISSQSGERLGKTIRRELLEFLFSSSGELTSKDREMGQKLLDSLAYFESQGKIAEKDMLTMAKDLLEKFNTISPV